MNKLMLSVVVLIILFLTGCGDAGKGVPKDLKLLEPDKVYEIDGWGSNPDIYEFTPVGQEHMVCLILVSGVDSASGLSCFPKKEGE